MKIALFAMLITLIFSPIVRAQSSDRLEQLTRRIEELEKQQEELLLQSQSRGNQVSSFLKDSLTFGGFLDAAITGIQGPDTNLQVLNSSNLLGINLAADFSDNLHFVSQFLIGLVDPLNNPHNNPAGSPTERKFGDPFFGAVLTQGYLELTQSDHFRIQAGIGYAPFGYALQQRELVLFARRGGPQLLRTNQLVAVLWSGLQALGEFSRKGGGEWGYNVYTTNPLDNDRSRVLGMGGRLWMSGADDTVVGGLSTQVSKYGANLDEIVGSDLRMRLGNALITTEYARHVADGEDPWSVYLEPSIFISEEEWLLFVFSDYAENPLNTLRVGLNEIPDDYRKWEYGAGINWLPSPYTRLRLTFTQNDYVGKNNTIGSQNRDYQSLDLSVGVAF